jgi:hypothetical protein
LAASFITSPRLFSCTDHGRVIIAGIPLRHWLVGFVSGLKMGALMGMTKKRAWTKKDRRNLKAHSKARTPVVKISKQMKRTVGALRQKAFQLGFRLGHQR